jgi:superfamily II DNA/RNA helicase
VQFASRRFSSAAAFLKNLSRAGRLWEFISNGHLYFLSLHALRMLIIDEADRMLTSGHFKELQVLLPFLHVMSYALLYSSCYHVPPVSFSRILFSET